MQEIYGVQLASDRQYLIDEGDVLLARPINSVEIRDNGPFLDGPVSPRVAVLDFDEETGELHPGARLLSPKGKRGRRRYALDEALLDPDCPPGRFDDRNFVQVSVFSTVYETLQFLESLLGRRIPWAFGRDQLLVVPRAGNMQNAFYERETGSLQFFGYDARPKASDEPQDRSDARVASGTQRRILTALSRDIVAHETAHAVLDGVAPDLYHATHPESLGLHEAVGDLAAAFLAFTDEMIIFSIDAISSTTLDIYEALAAIGEEFGTDVRRSEGASSLRSALSRRSFNAGEDQVDALGLPLRVDRHDAHDCGQVLTGSVFSSLRARAERSNPRSAADWDRVQKQIIGAARDVSRVVFPALNRLPPGEATFADFARALDAAGRETRLGPAIARETRTELFERGVGESVSALQAPPPPDQAFNTHRIRDLVENDDAASSFAELHRDALGIPAGVAIEPGPRALFWDRSWDVKTRRRRLRFSVTWEHEEEHEVVPALGRRWRFRVGATLVLDTTTLKACSLLRTETGATPRTARRERLELWSRDGLLRPVDEALDPSGQPLPSVLTAEVAGGALRVRGTARTLHIVG